MKRAEINAFKSAGCADCGYADDVGRLDFHHLDPSTKLFNVGAEINRSPAVLEAEMAKCVVLCRACHAKRHRQTPKIARKLPGTTLIHYRIDPDAKRRSKAAAAYEGQTLKAFLEVALEEAATKAELAQAKRRTKGSKG